MKGVNYHKGFTIIELLIALSFFSFLLMALTVGFVQINRAYTKGITVKTIQENGRVLMNDITRAIRSSGDGVVTVSANPYRLCINGIRYGWNQGTDNNGARSEETFLTSTVPMVPSTEKITLAKTMDGANCTAKLVKSQSEAAIDRRAIVQYLSVSHVGASQVWKVKLILSTSETSDLSSFGETAKCKEQVGNQFCDIAKFETIVSVRN